MRWLSAFFRRLWNQQKTAAQAAQDKPGHQNEQKRKGEVERTEDRSNIGVYKSHQWRKGKNSGPDQKRVGNGQESCHRINQWNEKRSPGMAGDPIAPIGERIQADPMVQRSPVPGYGEKDR